MRCHHHLAVPERSATKRYEDVPTPRDPLHPLHPHSSCPLIAKALSARTRKAKKSEDHNDGRSKQADAPEACALSAAKRLPTRSLLFSGCGRPPANLRLRRTRGRCHEMIGRRYVTLMAVPWANPPGQQVGFPILTTISCCASPYLCPQEQSRKCLAPMTRSDCSRIDEAAGPTGAGEVDGKPRFQCKSIKFVDRRCSLRSL